ncbi:MAP kinase kinase Wis1 [Friedmanniomyces endolithicus]|uniref:mitogen-activated protein kinase kinase n=1 Tax=Friedmanniomyces endolithicus TaxID=329885 RepID=A0AAN6R0Z6_9PEZI|nr:MAP kinase kinase Wis1 [Friedmanniomyces endolithicus]KAK0297548.1 MAP kinase kinase Wis1 [Friedmanniomyces endolithicus]KAK0312672.1 MAP kinase kinase Wis1 [Friedmanniomyces endolithicus]KAK0827387.1 MAP kinase kinase Wis1 [Friedmanniomyces endolithicus]KAK0930804.1 MAP kinase kinase Wis1 [Friedmanniomyces endolithicus]
MASTDEPLESLESPLPPTSPEDTLSSPPLASNQSYLRSPPPPLRMQSDMTASSTISGMSATSRPLGNISAARGPPSAARAGASALNPDIAARMKAFHMSRQNTPAAGALPRMQPQATTPTVPVSSIPQGGVGGFPANMRLPPSLQRPAVQPANSSPVVPVLPGGGVTGRAPTMAERRGLKLPGGLPGAAPPSNPAAPGAPAGRKKPGMKLPDMGGGSANGGVNGGAEKGQSQMEKMGEFIDTKNGALKLGKATVNAQGIEFATGKTFHISLEEVDTLDELGKGNYGTVYKVRHARPKFRRVGQGLAGNKALRVGDRASEDDVTPVSPTRSSGTTGLVMAMKEMRLELDEAKFQSIIMELDILHRCISPHIVDFYGAFFQEGCVFICMEFMDGGSLDKIYGDGVPENVLRKVTFGTVLGLKSLKEEHNIIHRDVKPTNVLVNTRGQVKLCDFGVSGNLVASIAKTNIGCQSYMAPERISGGGMASAGAGGGTYSVQSDIWSLGLTIIECGMGRYPYPPDTYDNIFSQLSAIVDGVPPDLPADQFSEAARDFAAGCLNKIPNLRPTYPMLLQHAWLAPLVKPATIMEEDEEAEEEDASSAPGEVEKAQQNALGLANGGGQFVDREVGEWVIGALDRRKRGVMGKSAKPALHAAPLDAVGNSSSPGPKIKAVAVDA